MQLIAQATNIPLPQTQTATKVPQQRRSISGNHRSEPAVSIVSPYSNNTILHPEESNDKDNEQDEIDSRLLDELAEQYKRGMKALETATAKEKHKQTKVPKRTESLNHKITQPTSRQTKVVTEKQEVQTVDSKSNSKVDNNISVKEEKEKEASTPIRKIEKLSPAKEGQFFVALTNVPNEALNINTLTRYFDSAKTLHLSGLCPCTDVVPSEELDSDDDECDYAFKYDQVRLSNGVPKNSQLDNGTYAFISLHDQLSVDKLMKFLSCYPLTYVSDRDLKAKRTYLEGEELIFNSAFDFNNVSKNSNVPELTTKPRKRSYLQGVVEYMKSRAHDEAVADMSCKIVALTGLLPEQFEGDLLYNIFKRYGEVVSISSIAEGSEDEKEERWPVVLIEYNNPQSARRAYADGPAELQNALGHPHQVELIDSRLGHLTSTEKTTTLNRKLDPVEEASCSDSASSIDLQAEHGDSSFFSKFNKSSSSTSSEDSDASSEDSNDSEARDFLVPVDSSSRLEDEFFDYSAYGLDLAIDASDDQNNPDGSKSGRSLGNDYSSMSKDPVLRRRERFRASSLPATDAGSKNSAVSIQGVGKTPPEVHRETKTRSVSASMILSIPNPRKYRPTNDIRVLLMRRNLELKRKEIYLHYVAHPEKELRLEDYL